MFFDAGSSNKVAFGRKHCRPLARRKETPWFIFPFRPRLSPPSRERWFILRLSLPVLLSSAQSPHFGSLSAHLLPGRLMKRSKSPSKALSCWTEVRCRAGWGGSSALHAAVLRLCNRCLGMSSVIRVRFISCQDFGGPRVYSAERQRGESRWLNTSASQIAAAQSTQRRLMAQGERRSPGAGSCKSRKIPHDAWKH